MIPEKLRPNFKTALAKLGGSKLKSFTQQSSMKTKSSQSRLSVNCRAENAIFPFCPASQLAHWILAVVFLAAVCAKPLLAAPVTPPRVLILGTTVTGGAASQEAVIATGLGFTVDIVTPANWALFTTTTGPTGFGFLDYRALVLGDPTCSVSTNPISAAVTNRAIWSAASGNVIIMGEDFSYHAVNGSGSISPSSKTLITNALQFATADTNKTGLFISLSCYYGSASAGTLVPLLDKLSTPANQAISGIYNGPFTVRGGGFEKIHITAAHPALAGLTDALLSNFSQSSHETFTTWPADFIPLAIATDSTPPNYSGGVPVKSGTPYIMVRGQGVVALGDKCLSITNRSLDCTATNGTYAWSFCVTNQFTGPVGFLSFPNLPSGVTVQNDILQLNPVLQPGQGTCLTINITNTLGPTNLCFTVAAHSTNLVQCCAITNCLSFTPCCAYVFNETVTAIPGAANCYNYSLAVRNVSTQAVSYVFLVPDPYSTCSIFTPDIVHLATPLLPGQQTLVGPIKVCITPSCPKPLCFLVSLQNSNFVQCCAARHCLPPPINPPIALGNPADGTVFLTPTAIPLAVDLSGDIRFSSVTYRANDQVIGSSSVAPYSVVWSNAPPGDYVLRAEGMETVGGGIWVSDPVSIYVRTDQDGTGALGPALLAPAVLGGNDHFSLQTRTGVSYLVECSDSIIYPSWHPLKVIVGDGGVVPLSYSYTNTPTRFYRVRVQQ